MSQLQHRYGNWPKHERPRVYQVAFTDDYAATRQWVQEHAATLDETGLRRLVSKLRDPRSFTDAFHELCVATILRPARGSVSYEPQIDGVTPDFLIDARSDRPLIVEVWTRHRPDTAAREHRQWLALQQRLEQIPVAARLIVLDGPPERPAPADSALVRDVVAGVREWLMSPLTQGTPTHTVHGYTFAVVGRAPRPRVEFGVPGGAGGSSTADQILGSISAKVARYRRLAERLGAELLVVVAGDGGSAMSRALLADTLAGHNVVSLSFSPFDIGPLGGAKVQLRPNDDPPVLDSALSAVAWLEVDDRSPPGALSVFPNPRSVRPLRDVPTAG